MKERVTQFDLDAAFKALDDIEIPKVRGVRANRVDLSEATKRVDRTSMLIEDYYDLGSKEDLENASEERDAEIAKAKLAKIEKIVDLNAESEEDILPSYVGKVIIQCPQCMTLFYKDEADLERSEEDPNTANVGEICQHCGNDTGYTIIGKVAEEEVPETEIPEEEPISAETEEESAETNTEEVPESTEGEEDIDLAAIDLPNPEESAEEEEENKEESEEEKNESLNNSKLLKDIKKKNELASENTSENLTLNESIDDENLAFDHPIVIKTVNCNKIKVEARDKELARKVDKLASEAYAKSDELSGWEYFDEIAEKRGLKFEVVFDESIDDENLFFNRPLVVDTVNCNKIMVELEDEDLAKKVDELASAAYAKSDKYSGWEYFDRFAAKYGLKFEVIFDDDDDFNESVKKTKLQEITSTYDFIIYAVDKNGDTVIEKDFHGRVKDAKAEMQAILANDSDENITDVFISKKNGREEIPMDHLTLSRSEYIDDDALDAALGLKKTEESLKEDLDTDMSKYNAYIDYIQAQIKADEEELKKAGDNQLIKDAIQKKLDAHKADLESALPPAVKDAQAVEELPTPEEVNTLEDSETEKANENKEEKEKNESLNNSELLKDIEKKNELATENASENTTLNESFNAESTKCKKCGKEICECDKTLTEDSESEAAIDAMFNSKEFRTPISDAEVQGYLDQGINEKFDLNELESVHDKTINECITKYFTNVYGNVNSFKMTDCQVGKNNTLIIEGLINFKSGKSKKTIFEFTNNNGILEGYNKTITSTKAFRLKTNLEDSGKTLITEGMVYNYKVGTKEIKGRV